MGLEDLLSKEISAVKSPFKKAFLYTLVAFIVIPTGAYIVGYMNQKGVSDYQHSRGPVIVIVSTVSEGFTQISKFIKDTVVKETNTPRYILAAYLLASFLFGYFFLRVRDFFGSIVQNLKDRFTKKGDLIFEDDFSTDTGWHLKYWEKENKKDINYRISNGMVFKATPGDISNRQGKFGAYRDFPNLSIKGTYQITTWVRSGENSTMKFQLWLHNDLLNKGSSWTKREPTNAITPSERVQKIVTNFAITETRALRIHLEATPGEGMIVVEKIRLEHMP